MTDAARRLVMRQLLSTLAVMTCRLSRAANRIPPDEPLMRAHSLLIGLQSEGLNPFLREWPPPSKRRSVAASSVPVLRWLPQVQQSAPAFSASLVEAVVEAAPSLAWRRSYSAAAAGVHFYECYGWTEFAGLLGPVPSQHLACGVLLLGPNVTYPPHRHEADEIYVPLVGTALWRRGNAAWRERPPGAVIHHARHQSHAMQTGPDPLLALYLWRSKNLGQSSHLDHPLSAAARE